MQIFISHSSKNAAVAEKMCKALEEQGVKCFIAPRDIRQGREYAEEIINGLEQSSAVILLMSKEANESPHVLREVEFAVSKRIPILVYELEEVVLTKSMKYFLMTHQWISKKGSGDYKEILDFVRSLEPREAAGEEEKAIHKPAKKHRSIGKYVAAAAVIFVAALAAFFLYSNVQKNKAVKVELGDTVFFGSYYDEDIAWRVLRISEDGTQAVLLSKDILTMKAFDTAEGGFYNRDGNTYYWSEKSDADTDLALQIKVRGNSDWSASNLRTWLNADTEVVVYQDQPPVQSAMSEKKNGYQNEAGFLSGFTKEELAAIVEQENTTVGNKLSETETVTTHDRVYLLSVEELAWLDEAGIRKWAVPTQAAVEHDDSCWYLLDYNEFGIEELSWWLRDPDPEAGSLCFLTDNGYTANEVRKANAGLEGYGVRPAITVDLRLVTFRETGTGEE